jgi:hypothetical protein
MRKTKRPAGPGALDGALPARFSGWVLELFQAAKGISLFSVSFKESGQSSMRLTIRPKGR